MKLREWQLKLMPLMSGMIIVAAFFFAFIILDQTRRVEQRIDGFRSKLPESLESDAGSA